MDQRALARLYREARRRRGEPGPEQTEQTEQTELARVRPRCSREPRCGMGPTYWAALRVHAFDREHGALAHAIRGRPYTQGFGQAGAVRWSLSGNAWCPRDCDWRRGPSLLALLMQRLVSLIGDGSSARPTHPRVPLSATLVRRCCRNRCVVARSRASCPRRDSVSSLALSK